MSNQQNDTIKDGRASAFAVAPGSASLTRYEACEMEMAYHRLARHPEAQAEAIARHYLAHAASAQHLLKIIEMARYTEMTDETQSAIKYITDQIRTNHRCDLGIELSWPNNEFRGARRETPDVER